MAKDNPSFAAIGTAAGLHTVRIEHPSELGNGLRSLSGNGDELHEVAKTNLR